MASLAQETKTPIPAEDKHKFKPIRSRQANKIGYTDAEGVVHSIYIPKGSIKAAEEYLIAKNFEELAKYPAWGES